MPRLAASVSFSLSRRTRSRIGAAENGSSLESSSAGVRREQIRRAKTHSGLQLFRLVSSKRGLCQLDILVFGELRGLPLVFQDRTEGLPRLLLFLQFGIHAAKMKFDLPPAGSAI
jgi:hypothetical protein